MALTSARAWAAVAFRVDPAERLEVLTASARGGERGVVTERGPQLRRLVEPRRHERLERRRHDPDDPVGHVVHRHRAADDTGVRSEAAPPQAVAQQDHVPLIRTVFGCGESPPERGRDAEHREVVPAHPHRAQPLRVASRDERRIPGSNRRHLRERAAAVAQIVKRGVADVAGDPSASRSPIITSRSGIRVRQRPEEDGVDDAEDGGVGADAERQRHERREREPGSPRERAHRVAQVLEQRFGERQTALIAVRFSDLREAPDPHSRLAPGVVRVHAGETELLFRHGQVELELVVQVGGVVGPAPEDERRETARPLAQPAHAPCPLSSRPMTSTTRCHSAASRTSCFFPPRVRL